MRPQVPFGPFLLGLAAVACGSKDDTLLDASGSPVATVTCNSVYGEYGGAQLVDPPVTCRQTWSRCSDGHDYEIICDGLGCTCSVDGQTDAADRTPDGPSFPSPRCPELLEAAESCGWPIGYPSGAGVGSSALQGMPCGIGSMGDPGSCACVDGLWMCPGIGGCNVVGRYTVDGSEPSEIHFLAEGAFYVAAASENATLEQVMWDQVDGFYGSWTLQGDILSVRSYHATYDAACVENPGRYAVEFDSACQLTQLRPLDDLCVERWLLGEPLAQHP